MIDLTTVQSGLERIMMAPSYPGSAIQDKTPEDIFSVGAEDVSTSSSSFLPLSPQPQPQPHSDKRAVIIIIDQVRIREDYVPYCTAGSAATCRQSSRGFGQIN